MGDWNTIRLLRGEECLTAKEYAKYKRGDSIWGIDSDPDELLRFSIEQEEDAQEALRAYKCALYNGIDTVHIVEYALEYFEADEDGEFIQGSDFDYIFDTNQ